MIRYCKELETIAKYDVTVVGSGPSGICAAVAAEEGVTPRQLDVKLVQKALTDKGADLFS